MPILQSTQVTAKILLFKARWTQTRRFMSATENQSYYLSISPCMQFKFFAENERDFTVRSLRCCTVFIMHLNLPFPTIHWLESVQSLITFLLT